MGIRPQLYLICGINDLQVNSKLEITDPRYKPTMPWEELQETIPLYSQDNLNIKLAIENPNGTLKQGYELIAFNPEFGVPTAIGYIIDKANYASDILYALSACFEQFKESTIVPIPTYDNPHNLTYKGRRYSARKMTSDEEKEYLLAVYNNQLPKTFHYDIDTHLEAAHYLLNWFGLELKRKELRLYLYWVWS